MGKRKQSGRSRRSISPDSESQLKKLDPMAANFLAGIQQPKPKPLKTLSDVYIGAMNTLSFSQACHSGSYCSNEVWIDSETTLRLYKDKQCRRFARHLAIYNGGRVRDNSSLLTTAVAAYLAKAPVTLQYLESNEAYARLHGRLFPVVRLWFERCTPCGCEEA